MAILVLVGRHIYLNHHGPRHNHHHHGRRSSKVDQHDIQMARHCNEVQPAPMPEEKPHEGEDSKVEKHMDPTDDVQAEQPAE